MTSSHFWRRPSGTPTRRLPPPSSPCSPPPAPKIGEAEAKRLEDAVAERFKNQTAQPGTEASLRKEIDELQRRQVNYGELPRS
jgi:hypothetical protein